MQELMSSEDRTMSSLEIAELTGKRHAHVLRDVESLINQEAITKPNFGLSEYKDASGKSNPMYNLDYEATMVLITGYDAKRRSMVIKRWIALEKGEAVSAVSMKKEELELRLIAGKYAAEMEMVAVQSAATFLRVSDSSKLEMMHIVFEGNGVKTTALPQFTEKVRTVCSATHLLEQNNCPIKVRAFNAALIKHGFLEKLKRLATQRTFKTYNSLTEKGLQYGQNDAYKGASTQTQAHLYSDTFMELYERVVK
jgi:Rha family phage regulatory protein